MGGEQVEFFECSSAFVLASGTISAGDGGVSQPGQTAQPGLAAALSGLLGRNEDVSETFHQDLKTRKVNEKKIE